MKKNEYEGFKVTKLEYEEPSIKYNKDYIGNRDTYVCPECEYLGEICQSCRDKYL